MENCKLANPGSLGLIGFGMTTILLSIHNAGLLPLMTTIVAVGIFYGGIAQVIAGIMEFKKGNTFGLVAFVSYGMFWLSLIAIWYIPSTNTVASSNSDYVGVYLTLWAIFTLFMFFGTLKANYTLRLVFGTLFITFVLLAIENFTGSHAIGITAGYFGIICGALAFYLAMAEVLNEVYGRHILPVGQP